MIVPMKKVNIYVFQGDRKALLSALQTRSLVMITGEPHPSAEEQIRLREAALQNTAAALSFLRPYSPKSGMLQRKPALPYAELVSENTESDALAAEVLSVQHSIRALEGQAAAIEIDNTALLPWIKLDIPLHSIQNTRHVHFHTGFFPSRNLHEIDSVKEAGSTVVLLGENAAGTAALLAAHRDVDEAVCTQAKALGFMETPLPEGTGLAQDIYQENETALRCLHDEIAEQYKLAQRAAEKTDALKQQHDREATCLAAEEAPYESTDTMISLEGWIRSDRLTELEEALKSVSQYYAYDLRDPLAEEKPPTVTQNNAFISQFEAITDMFSMPDPRDVLDPNTVMGIWYWIIFGMMMGDVGYGLMMVVLIGGYKLLTGNNSKLPNILFYSGFTSIFWGVMFGSYFGEALFPPVIAAPLDNIMLMMVFCLGVGVLHIFSGMILKMYIDWKEGHPWDGVFDQLSGMLLVVGLILMVVSPVLGQIIALIGAGTIVLMAGRDKKNPIARFGGGLMGLYNTLTGLFSDILSYCRILALMLSSGIVAMVMNILAGLVMPSSGSGIIGIIVGGVCGIAIYIVGHIFNLVLSLLSAYVHDSRLQYLEFFGKFYEGGGYAFKPLSPHARYLNIKNKG